MAHISYFDRKKTTLKIIMKILLASDFTVVIKALLVLGKSVKGENAKLLSYKMKR